MLNGSLMPWMARVLVVTIFVTIAAILMDWIAAEANWPRRWIWCSALGISIGLPVVAVSPTACSGRDGL